MKVIDLNCGAGGGSLAFLNAGYTVEASYGFDEDCLFVFDRMLDRKKYYLPISNYYNIEAKREDLVEIFEQYQGIDVAYVNFYPLGRGGIKFMNGLDKIRKIMEIVTTIIKPKIFLFEVESTFHVSKNQEYSTNLKRSLYRRNYDFENALISLNEWIPIRNEKYFMLIYPKGSLDINASNNPLVLAKPSSPRKKYEEFLQIIEDESEYEITSGAIKKLKNRLAVENNYFHYTGTGTIDSIQFIPVDYPSSVGPAVAFRKDGVPRRLTEMEIALIMGYPAFPRQPSTLRKFMYKHLSQSPAIPLTQAIATLIKDLIKD